jgi:hypothetical protein
MLVLVLLVACGDDATSTSDARPSCTMTADPHDEDGDGIVDACDNCPAVANANQADVTEINVRAFADGVGDACDPRPGVGGDDLRAFYSFASDAQATAWTGTGWSISGDELHASGTATWTITRAFAGDGYLVRAEITSLTAAAPNAFVIAIDGDGISAGATCTLQDTQLSVVEAGGTPSSVMLANVIAPGESFTLIAWRTISLSGSTRVPELTCRVVHGGEMRQTSLQLTDENVTGTHAIVANAASVDISSLGVYTSPGPKNP